MLLKFIEKNRLISCEIGGLIHLSEVTLNNDSFPIISPLLKFNTPKEKIINAKTNNNNTNILADIEVGGFLRWDIGDVFISYFVYFIS